MISLCMIVKDEEDTLDRCLKSAEGIADEIIIVDTGSTDCTVEIAKKYTDKVYSFKWINDFSAARNFSISKANGDWILILDADEEVCHKTKDKIRELSTDYSVDVYFFNSLSIMDQKNRDSIIINQNPRLFQNKSGYRYEGEVHNQLVSVIQRINPNMVIKFIPIDIYHYGYSKDIIIKKDKRNRNMTLLQKQLEKDPENPFANYNIGNEYFAINNKKEALNHYLKAYNSINPNIAYYTKVIIRLMICSMDLKLYDDVYMYAANALKSYPELTDIYYLRGIINNIIGRPTAAVRDLERALELGEPPQHLVYFQAAGTYKSLESLYHIYFDFEDYEKCLDCCMKLIKYPEKVTFDFLKILIHCVYKLKLPVENALKFIIDNSKETGYIYVCNILLLEKDYTLALEYVNKGLEYINSNNFNDSLKNYLINNLQYYKGVCEFNLKNYEKSIATLMNIDEKKAMHYNIPHIFIAGMIIQDENAIKFSMSSNSPSGKVCSTLYNILNNNTAELLSEDIKESAAYKNIIFSILRMLLNIEENELFQNSLKILELINNNTTFLELGKLYYEYGKYDLCKKEMIHSIAMNNVIDKSGLRVLYNSL